MKKSSVPYTFLMFVKLLYQSRSLIGALALREIQGRYVGTFGGVTWSVVNPLAMILVYWFVFSVGFKVEPPGGVPFIIVFLCGLIPWTLFSETLMSSVNVIRSNPHFVKKMVFPTEVLVVVNLVASLVTHIIMLSILFVLMWLNGLHFSIFNFQFVFYLFALMIFTMGLSWLVSALNVFYKDIGQILGVVLNLWFWMTPIVWMVEMVPEKYQFYLNLNPMLYIVMGYKNSFLFETPFWSHYRTGGMFWGVSLFVFVVGGLVFRRLKPDFAEVL
jgi:ABC-type polysaccharide/polyol phosphate export permease